jgi:hypothetical protein
MNPPRPIAAVSRGVRSLSREALRVMALALSAALVIVLLLMALDWGAQGATGAATAPPKHPAHVATPKTPKPLPSAVPLGVYAGAGSPAAATVFAADTGTTVRYALDYFDATSWSTISDPSWFLARWAGTNFQMIFGVPMLPKTGASLAAGARGDYNGLFATLAQVLIDNGQASAILMPGWDPEDSSYPWAVSTTTQAEQYVAEFNQIVATMRAVPGAQFQFVWDASGSSHGIAPSALYPGDAVVNLIATGAFDIGIGPPAQRWSEVSNSAYGITWFDDFAEHHDKPFMIAEWGLAPTAAQGGGDDPLFVQDLLTWASQRHVFAAVTWDYGSWAITGGSFPRSASLLRQISTESVESPLANVVESSAASASGLASGDGP